MGDSYSVLAPVPVARAPNANGEVSRAWMLLSQTRLGLSSSSELTGQSAATKVPGATEGGEDPRWRTVALPMLRRQSTVRSRKSASAESLHAADPGAEQHAPLPGARPVLARGGRRFAAGEIGEGGRAGLDERDADGRVDLAAELGLLQGRAGGADPFRVRVLEPDAVGGDGGDASLDGAKRILVADGSGGRGEVAQGGECRCEGRVVHALAAVVPPVAAVEAAGEHRDGVGLGRCRAGRVSALCDAGEEHGCDGGGTKEQHAGDLESPRVPLDDVGQPRPGRH